MNYRRYLDNVNRLRTRLDKISLRTRRLLTGLCLFIIILSVLAFEIQPGGGLEVGKPSPKNIYALKDFDFLDMQKTAQRRKEAALRVADVVVYDGRAASRNLEDLVDFFALFSDKNSMTFVDVERKAEELSKKYGAQITSETLTQLLQLTPEDLDLVNDASYLVLSEIVKSKITSENLEEFKASCRARIAKALSHSSLASLAQTVVESFLRPNSRIDYAETQARRLEAMNKVKPVYTTVRQGDLIVSRGELVTRDIAEMAKIAGVTGIAIRPLTVSRYAVILLVILVLSGLYLSRFQRMYYDSPGMLALLCSLLVFFTLVAKLLSYLYFSLSQTWMFLLPISAITIITSVLFNSDLAILALLVCSVMTGINFAGNFQPAAFTALGGSIPAFLASRKSDRHELRTAGLITSAWLGFVAFGISYLTTSKSSVVLNTTVGFLNGVAFSIMAMGILPFLETTFRITTHAWLLELASPEQQLLKELSLKAPGTYSHSIMVANLAEAAAREIGADPILARVAAYYHDIGKIKRPHFFIENQPPGRSPHEGLKPSLSALIITSHVRDSVEILEKNHFPPDIISIIRSHHGTGFVRYFYERALERMPEEGEIDESRFRYRYDLPKGKTAGILLLADSVEATARTLPRRTPAALEQMIERIVNEKLTAGQLDQSDLTFRDLKRIKMAFLKILGSSYHPRMEYPAVVVLKGESRNGSEFNIRDKMGPRKRTKANRKSESNAS